MFNMLHLVEEAAKHENRYIVDPLSYWHTGWFTLFYTLF